MLLCFWCLMVGHLFYFTGKHKKADSSQMLRWEKRFPPLHFILCPIYSNTKYFSLSWLLFKVKPCTYSSSSHLSSVILPFSYHCFFLPSKPFSFPLLRALMPSSFLQCLLCASLPPSVSFSLPPFLQNTAGHVMNTWNSPWGVERSVSMLMTPALLNTNTLHGTTIRVIWPFSTASVSWWQILMTNRKCIHLAHTVFPNEKCYNSSDSSSGDIK